MYLTPDDEAAGAAVLRVLEAEIRKLGSGSEIRGVLDDWAQMLSTDPPGWATSVESSPGRRRDADDDAPDDGELGALVPLQQPPHGPSGTISLTEPSEDPTSWFG